MENYLQLTGNKGFKHQVSNLAISASNPEIRFYEIFRKTKRYLLSFYLFYNFENTILGQMTPWYSLDKQIA